MKKPAKFNLFSNISFQEKTLFTKHLATMYKSGIPVSDALTTLIEQTRSSAFKKILKEVLSDIDNGQTMAKALAKHPQVFNEFYTSLVRVSEESGTLEENLEFLAGQLKKDYSLRKKIQSALLYPMIVFGIMMAMGVFISVFVLPKLVEFFNSFNVELPTVTKVLIFIANVSSSYGVYILIGLALLAVVFRVLLRFPSVRLIWDGFVIKLPLFGKLISFGQLSRFSRNFGVLIKSGVPIVYSLEITASTLSNLRFKKSLIEISKRLAKGKEIGAEMKNKKYNEYPPIVSMMISIGERSGRLDEVLLYLGDFYEDEIDDLSKNLSTVIEPVLLVIIALMVGFVALAIISPIYELTGSIRK